MGALQEVEVVMSLGQNTVGRHLAPYKRLRSYCLSYFDVADMTWVLVVTVEWR